MELVITKGTEPEHTQSSPASMASMALVGLQPCLLSGFLFLLQLGLPRKELSQFILASLFVE